jgi:hypothetical protein
MLNLMTRSPFSPALLETGMPSPLTLFSYPGKTTSGQGSESVLPSRVGTWTTLSVRASARLMVAVKTRALPSLASLRERERERERERDEGVRRGHPSERALGDACAT